MSKYEIRNEVRVRDSGKEKNIHTSNTVSKSTAQEIEELIGDGKAQVERSRSIKFGVGYGNLTIYSSCTVRLTCNQNAATVKKAIDLATKICDCTIFEEDAKLMQEFLEHYDT